MLVSHEVPLRYMREMRDHMDYDYALVHLLDESEEYRNYFFESRRIGRKIILDNSAYEIKMHPEKFNYPDGIYPMDQYKRWIDRLQPDLYIIPDSKLDGVDNRAIMEKWLNTYCGENGTIGKSRALGVVHGKGVVEMIYNYRYILSNAYGVAISFEDWWLDCYSSTPIYQIRRDILKMLSNNVEDELKDRYHHILGCVDPLEYKYLLELCKLPRAINIASTDTSWPITKAIDEKVFSRDDHEKSKSIISRLFYLPHLNILSTRMENNIDLFREMINEYHQHVYIYDFDNTLVKSDAKVRLRRRDTGEVLDTYADDTFRDHKLRDDEYFDFSDFESQVILSHSSVLTPLFEEFRNRVQEGCKVVILTSRVNLDIVDRFCEEQGVNMEDVYIVSANHVHAMDDVYVPHDERKQFTLRRIRSILPKYGVIIHHYDDDLSGVATLVDDIEPNLVRF